MNKQTRVHWSMTLVLACCALSGVAQTPEAKGNNSPEIYKTIYLTNLTDANDVIEVQKDLHNMLPQAKLFYIPWQAALSVRASAEDVALAEKIVADLDKTKKLYRLTYTMTESESGKTIGVQHFSIIVASGSKTDFKQGSRVPVGTGNPGSSADASGITYLDVGQEIEASLDGYLDGVRLRSRVVQSSIAEDKSLVGPQDPVIRQTTLEGTSTLVQGKPLLLGSFDVPGSTRHQEVEVVSELVR